MIPTTLQLLVLLAISCPLILAQLVAIEDTLEINKLSIEFGVIPDVIQKPSLNKLYVFYGPTEVEPGRELAAARVQKQFSSILVRLSSNVSIDSGLFTLAMVDPDAPNGRQIKSDFLEQLHYLAINIPAQNMSSGPDTFLNFSLNKGEVLVSYVRPKPKPKTGEHRYVFVLYKQNVKIDNPPSADKQQFNISKWVLQQSLNITTVPFAVNFFLAKA